MKLSPSQFCALDSERNWVVSTGAGAGKTSVLTERYISLLRQHPELGVRNILTLTFTQKAAEEMKSRIYRRLNQELNAAGVEDNQETETLTHWLRLKASFSDNAISTFHAFCLQTLRQKPVEAQIDPNVSILSESEKRGVFRELYAQVFHDFINKDENGGVTEKNRQMVLLLQCWDQRRLRHLVQDFFNQKRKYFEFTRFFAQVCADENRFYAQILSAAANESFEKLKREEFFERLQGQIDKEAVGSPYAELLARIATAFGPKPEAAQLPALAPKVRTWLEDDLLVNVGRMPGAALSRAALRDILTDSGLADLDPTLDQTSLGYLGALIYFTNTFLQEYTAYCRDNALIDFDSLQEKTLALLEHHPTVRQELRERFRFILVDEFQDTDPLQWQILQSLATDDQNQLLTDRLFVVGDEKQAIYGFRGGDVRVFRAAKNQLLAANDGEKPLFFEKPDFAGSRLAQLMDSKALQEFLGQGHELARMRQGLLEFNDNYRSRPSLIEFFNFLFAKLLKPENGFDPPPQDLKSGKKEVLKDAAANVAFFTVPAKAAGGGEEDDPSQLGTRLLEAQMIAGFLQYLQKGEPHRDSFGGVDFLAKPGLQHVRELLGQQRTAVGVLFRRFTEIKTYEEVLRLAQIQFFVHRGKGFFRRQEVIDLFNTLEFLHDTRKDINLIGILRSPVFGCSDKRLADFARGAGFRNLFLRLKEEDDPEFKEAYELLFRWRQLKDRLRVSELIRKIIRDASWNAVFGVGIRGSQILYNVEKFIDLARAYEAKEVRGLGGFCEYLRELIDRDVDEGEASLDASTQSPVVMMTVHQAKGLQFPLVILPDLNGRFNFPNTEVFERFEPQDRTAMGHDYFLGISCPDPQKNFERRATLAQQVLRSLARKRILSEEKRLLYVGATRAMDHLILIGESRATPRQEKRRPDQVIRAWDWLEEIFALNAESRQVHLTEDKPPLPVIHYQDIGAWIQFADSPQWRIPDISKLTSQEKPNTHFTIALESLRSVPRLRLSATALSLFHRCQRKYYFRDVMGIPEFFFLKPKGDNSNDLDVAVDLEESGEAIKEPNPLRLEARRQEGNIRGNVVHWFLHHLAPLELPHLNEAVALQVDHEIQNTDFDLRVLLNPEKLQKSILDQLQRFKETPYYSLFRQLTKEPSKKILSEVSFEVEVGNVTLQGQIDKLFQRPEENTWTILDFKTQSLRSQKSPEALRKMAAEREYDLQLNFYALAAQKILGEASLSGLELYFTAEGRGAVSIPLKPQHLQNKLEEFSTKAVTFSQKKFEQIDFQKPIRDEICLSCGYFLNRVCPYPEKSAKT